jgi:hypothetical protein
LQLDALGVVHRDAQGNHGVLRYDHDGTAAL